MENSLFRNNQVKQKEDTLVLESVLQRKQNSSANLLSERETRCNERPLICVQNPSTSIAFQTPTLPDTFALKSVCSWSNVRRAVCWDVASWLGTAWGARFLPPWGAAALKAWGSSSLRNAGSPSRQSISSRASRRNPAAGPGLRWWLSVGLCRAAW